MPRRVDPAPRIGSDSRAISAAKSLSAANPFRLPPSLRRSDTVKVASPVVGRMVKSRALTIAAFGRMLQLERVAQQACKDWRPSQPPRLGSRLPLTASALLLAAEQAHQWLPR